MHVQPDLTTFLPCPTPFSWLILAIRRMRVIYDSSKEWVCSLFILRDSEDRVLAWRIEGHRVPYSPTIAT